MDREYMYGDAKATAKAVDAGRKQRQLTEAQSAFDTEPGIDTGLALAKAMFEAGHFNDAEKVLDMLNSGYRDNIDVLWNLGFVYKNQDRHDEAIQMFQRVVAIDAKHQLARSAELMIWEMDPSIKPSWMRK